MNTHAFLDESARGPIYLMCAASVEVGQLDSARRSVRTLCAPGQRRIHFATEGDQRRRQLLSHFSALDARCFVYVAHHHDQVEARSAIVKHAALHLLGLGVGRIVLEARQGQDHRDRADLFGVVGGDRGGSTITYTHHTASAEPLLWIADAVAWAWGRGGVWRKQVVDLGLVAGVETVATT
jgi:hypothetical protein